ncbi:MAG TPA: hypothetical protein ENH72_02680 [Pseudomonas sabulinigri]|uniref:PASTA domain-containing protein n=1 Tax=marine sediment metagenome TaxID=412755 RepID=A0A0F9VVA6_9ZZZZ|nr:hypothetical protein [Halopseudomonas sabulinigri]HEC51526.1 hypothetical protein [Halopseudomonas sabulinigri]|tara:strand:- start:3637 stop:4314 length:678 start_codon:yes stop_codon:yes gene_type:complete
MPTIKDLVSDVMAAPIGDIIASVGQGVAQAQEALDRASLAQVLAIYHESDSDEIRLLQEIGYQPTFYALPDTTGEIQVALSISGQNSASSTPAATTLPAARTKAMSLAERFLPRLPASKIYAAPVNADLTNRYGFQASAAAKIQFRIVPVPAPGRVSEIRVVPGLLGKLLDEAEALAARFSLEVIAVDKNGEPLATPPSNKKITGQLPEAGEISIAGTQIQVSFA